MTDSEPGQPGDPARPTADDDSPRARRAAARTARRDAAQKRRAERSAAKALAASRRQAALRPERPPDAEEPSDTGPAPEPLVVEERVVETIVTVDVAAEPEIVQPRPVQPEVDAPVKKAEAERIAEVEALAPENEKASSDGEDVLIADAEATPARGRMARRVDRDDHIVEAPRKPKVPLVQRLRPSKATTGSTIGARRRLVSVIAGALGAVGLICSVVLAVGALLVAMGADDSTLYDTLSGICDALVGPLRDAFSFSGVNAETKESLVAWGAGSIGYLVVGVMGQSLLRSTVDR